MEFYETQINLPIVYCLKMLSVSTLQRYFFCLSPFVCSNYSWLTVFQLHGKYYPASERHFIFLTAPRCHCTGSHYDLRCDSCEAEAAYGLSSLRSLEGLVRIDLRFRTWRDKGIGLALNLEQHWPQVAVLQHLIKQRRDMLVYLFRFRFREL